MIRQKASTISIEHSSSPFFVLLSSFIIQHSFSHHSSFIIPHSSFIIHLIIQRSSIMIHQSNIHHY